MMENLKQYRNTGILLLSILLTLGMVYKMVFLGGNTGTQEEAQKGSYHLMEDFNIFMAGKTAVAMGEEEAAKPVYRLNDSDLVAPEPNQECFGIVDTPAQMQDILDQAASLLDGQRMYFTTETRLMEDSQIHYYLDDTIFAVTWKEVHDNCVYTFSEVKIAHPSQFRRFLSGGKYGSGVQTICSEMAASVNAVVAANGDFYAYRYSGTNVYDRQIYRYDHTGLHTCYIDDEGDLNFVYGNELESKEAVQQYVDDNGIRFCLCFGPVLVDNGELQEVRNYYLGEVNGVFSRAALCQMDSLHYLMATANYEGHYYNLPDMTKFAKNIHATGCRMGYALDGGQSATMIMNDQVINQVSYGDERKQSDIIYFATAIP